MDLANLDFSFEVCEKNLMTEEKTDAYSPKYTLYDRFVSNIDSFIGELIATNYAQKDEYKFMNNNYASKKKADTTCNSIGSAGLEIMGKVDTIMSPIRDSFATFFGVVRVDLHHKDHNEFDSKKFVMGLSTIMIELKNCLVKVEKQINYANRSSALALKQSEKMVGNDLGVQLSNYAKLLEKSVSSIRDNVPRLCNGISMEISRIKDKKFNESTYVPATKACVSFDKSLNDSDVEEEEVSDDFFGYLASISTGTLVSMRMDPRKGEEDNVTKDDDVEHKKSLVASLKKDLKHIATDKALYQKFFGDNNNNMDLSGKVTKNDRQNLQYKLAFHNKLNDKLEDEIQSGSGGGGKPKFVENLRRKRTQVQKELFSILRKAEELES